MTDIVLCIASTVAGYLVAPVGRQCGYVICTGSYVNELKEKSVPLENTRQRVQHAIDEARKNMKPIEPDVEEWVKKVEIVANNVRDVLDYEGRAKKTCFCGWLPSPKERYCLGKDARKIVQDIQGLIQQCRFERVSYENPPPGLVGGAPDAKSSASDGGNAITNSRASIFQDIMKALSDEKHKVIGVYGPGGVGKTTLLEEVEKKLRKEGHGKPFHMIVKAKVSWTPDLNDIQYQIADALGLDLKDKQSQQGRRELLVQRLQRDPNEKVLIILDDLWDELDLKAVGIPSRDESSNCKLLLASRYKDVLKTKTCAVETFHLKGLEGDEAFRLFEKAVGDRLKDDDELKVIGPRVVTKLAGLPLLINSVAATLKDSNVAAWRDASRKIDDSQMETIVKLSYDHLKSEDAKSLFLLCGLIGGTIRVEILFVLSMGLGLFEGFKTMEDGRDRLDKILEVLHFNCLLLDGGDDKNKVTIHDLYSEVVISTPFRGQNSLIMNNNSWSEEKLEKCWAICLMDVGSDRIAELMRCRSPDLKILMLSQPGDWDGSPAHRPDEGYCCRLDFTHMKQLRVLYLRSMHIPNLPLSIQILENLWSLYLDHCDVEDAAIIGKLKALQILSFAGSKISRLPKQIGELTKLRLLNLNNCKWLKIIEPGVLKGLVNLEELYMKGSLDGWMGTDEIPSESCNARFSELKSLTKLTTLEISILDPTVLLEDGDLPFGNLIRFWINIGDVQGGGFEGFPTLKLKLKGWDIQEGEFEGLRTMKLNLKGCDSILSNEWVQKTLSKAESLVLVNLVNQENIWNGRVTPVCFSKLKGVHIVGCHRLKNLWFLSEMQRLVHLEEIIVRECDALQAIITYDGGELEVAADDGVVLP